MAVWQKLMRWFTGTQNVIRDSERAAAAPMREREEPVDAKTAWELIRAGRAPDGLVVGEPLTATRSGPTELPARLSAPSISLRYEGLTSLPAGLTARRITVRSATLEQIGPGLRCDFLDLSQTSIRELPDGLLATNRLCLDGCQRLTRLPSGLATGTLILTNCTALRELPAGLRVAFLDLAGCASLRALPDDLRLTGGRLSVRDCAWLTRLPDGLGEVAELDLSGCLNLARLPDGLDVSSWIDVAGTAIAKLPARFAHVGARWRGVPVPRRVAFEPETLTPNEIFDEKNAEVRRVMMERFGYERLIEAANAEVLHQDRDALGGERRLLRVPIERDEDLVCVSVTCPSTGRKFLLRVPPDMRSCHQAVAWTAGFDDPELYRPAVET
jgi:hypothetical protein